MKIKQEHLMIAGVLIIMALFVVPSTYSIATGFRSLTGRNGIYETDNPRFPDGDYKFLLVTNGAGESFEGEFNQRAISSLTGQEPARPFTINIDLLEQTCEYNINENSLGNVYSNLRMRSSCRSPGITQSHCSDPSGFGGSTHRYLCSEKAGEVYGIDSSPIYSFVAQVTIDNGIEQHSFNLTNDQLSYDLLNVIHVDVTNLVTGFQGCPTPSADTVIYRPIDSQDFILKSKLEYTSLHVQSSVLQVPSVGYSRYNYGRCDGSSWEAQCENAIDSYDSARSRFMNADVTLSNICEVEEQTSGSTTLKCSPTQPAFYPEMTVEVGADYIGVHVPQGIPEIIDVSQETEFSAGNYTQFNVEVRNNGEADSFDIRATCGYEDITPRSIRFSANDGETVTSFIEIQGAGVITECNVSVNSVGNASQLDWRMVSLKLQPFCDLPTNPFKTLVFTEFGCQYVCNEYGHDYYESTCKDFTDIDSYNRIDGYDSMGLPIMKDYDGKDHCIGENEYMSLNRYMDAVYDGELIPFVPVAYENMYWLEAPYCQYVSAYGYETVDGEAVEVLGNVEYDYGVTPTNATYNDDGGSSGGVPSVPPVEDVIETSLELYGIAGVLLCISLLLGVGYLYVQKRGR